MTTIAWRAPFMVSDGRVTQDNIIVTERCEKIYRLANGALMGFAGAADTRPIEDLFKNVKTNRSFPEPKAISNCGIDFRAMLVLPNYSLWCVESGPDYIDEEGEKHKGVWYASIVEVNEPFFAIGSGSRWAKAAMDMGASAERAVRCAIKNDANSGGRVQAYELQPKRRVKVAA